MASNIDIFEEVELLYSVVSDPGCLDQLLENIRRKTNSISGSIQIDDLNNYQVVDGIFQGFSDSAISSYINEYAPLDISKRMAINSPLFYQGTPTLEELMDPKVFRASVFYNEWVKPQAHFIDTLGTCLLDYNKQQSLILTLQRDSTAGHFKNSNSQQYLAQLRPYLLSAMRAMNILRQPNTQDISIHYIDQPAFLIDSAFTILDCNAQALELENNSTWLWTRTKDSLQFKHPLQEKLERSVALNVDIFQTASTEKSEFYYTCDKGETFDIKVLPYRAANRSILITQSSRQAALLMIKPRQKKLDVALLKNLYNLTPVETTTTSLIFSGLNVKEVSEKMQRSAHTIRSSLKVIFQKIGVNRQAELIVKIANSAAYR
jgi:DNA-binding CsgD family transcriptional regulator